MTDVDRSPARGSIPFMKTPEQIKEQSIVLEALSKRQDEDKEMPTARRISTLTPYTANYVRTILTSLVKEGRVLQQGSTEAERRYARGKY